MSRIDWEEKLEILDFAFQPIINIKTGIIYGVEVFLRNYQEAGFDKIENFFQEAYEDKVLYRVDSRLKVKVFNKFKTIKFFENIKIFYNIDNRVLEMPDYSIGKMEKLLVENEINKNNLYFEINDKYSNNEIYNLKNMIDIYEERGFRIAINNFSEIFSDLDNLFSRKLDIFKIDMKFIREINKQEKKQNFVEGIVKIIHSLNGLVIAQGVENVQEYKICKKIGCDMVQGYYVEYPMLDIDRIKEKYQLDKGERIEYDFYKESFEENIIKNPSIYINENVEVILKLLKENKNLEVITIIDRRERPMGIIKENEIKSYLLSPFGQEILRKKNIKELLHKVKIVDIKNPIEEIIKFFLEDEELLCILIVEDGKYRGIFDRKSVNRLMIEKKITFENIENFFS